MSDTLAGLGPIPNIDTSKLTQAQLDHGLEKTIDLLEELVLFTADGPFRILESLISHILLATGRSSVSNPIRPAVVSIAQADALLRILVTSYPRPVDTLAIYYYAAWAADARRRHLADELAPQQSLPNIKTELQPPIPPRPDTSMVTVAFYPDTGECEDCGDDTY